MATNFPTSLDTTTELPTPSPSTPLGQTGNLKHSTQHTNANDAIIAMQTKMGITDSTNYDSLDYRVRRDGYTSRPASVATDSEEFDTTNPFTWVNQGTSTVAVSNGVLKFAVPQGLGTTSVLLVKTIASGTTWRYETMFFSHTGYVNFHIMGLGVRDSATGKWTGIGNLSNNSTTAWRMSLYYGTDGTYRGEISYDIPSLPPRIWYAVERSGTNIFFEYSLNGVNWYRQFTITTSGTEIGAAPNQIGFFAHNNGGTAGRFVVGHFPYLRRIS